MSENRQNNKPVYFLSSLLIGVFVLDIFNKFPIADEFPFSFIIKGFKSLFLVYIVWILLRYKLQRVSIYSLILLCGIFAFNQVGIYGFDDLQQFSNSQIAGNIRHFTILLFPIAFSAYLLNYKDLNYHLLDKIFFWLILLISACIWIGFLFDIQFFRTYTNRFGYSGIVPKRTTISYFFISALFLYYYKGVTQACKKDLYILFLIAITSLLVGTKAIYAFLILLLLYHAVIAQWYKKTIFFVGIVSVLSAMFLFREKLFHFINDKFHPLVVQYHERGLFSSLVSFRDEIFEENIELYLSKWEWWNWFIGGKIFQSRLFESSIMELITFFGVLGACGYLFIFYKNLLQSSHINRYQSMFFLFSTFMISVLAGQFFLNVSAITYFGISFLLIQQNKKSFV